MKNLNKRTKALLAIAGIVIVVVVVGLVIVQPGQDELVGTTVIHISPQNPTIAVGQILDMSINSVGNCFWSFPSENVALFTFGPETIGVTDFDTKSVKVIGRGPGQVVLTAKCFMFTRRTTITVH